MRENEELGANVEDLKSERNEITSKVNYKLLFCFIGPLKCNFLQLCSYNICSCNSFFVIFKLRTMLDSILFFEIEMLKKEYSARENVDEIENKIKQKSSELMKFEDELCTLKNKHQIALLDIFSTKEPEFPMG